MFMHLHENNMIHENLSLHNIEISAVNEITIKNCPEFIAGSHKWKNKFQKKENKFGEINE